MRKINPSLIIATTSLAVILALRWSEHAILLALVSSSIPFAVAIACSYSHRQSSHFRMALLLGIGLILGSCLGLRVVNQARSTYAGLPLHRVSSLQGIMREDSRGTATGQILHRIDLFSVGSDDGAVSQARGKVVLFDRSDRRFYTGEMVRVQGAVKLKDNRPERYFVGTAFVVHTDGFASPLLRFRAMALKCLVSQIEKMRPPASSLFKALFLGIRDEIPEQMRKGFVVTGTYHFLAISGLHVGIVYLLVLILLKLLRWQFMRWALATGILLVYLVLIGPRPSLVRATATAIVAGISALMDRDLDPLNLFGLVLLIILLINPTSVFSLAFQLSFRSIAGILFVGQALSRRVASVIPTVIRVPLACAVGAQFATAPIVITSYGVLYPVGIIVTAILIPMITVFIWCGVLMLILLPVGPSWLIEISRAGLHMLYTTILTVVGWFPNNLGLTRWFLPYYWYLLGIVIGLRVLNGLGLCQRHSGTMDSRGRISEL